MSKTLGTLTKRSLAPLRPFFQAGKSYTNSHEIIHQYQSKNYNSVPCYLVVFPETGDLLIFYVLARISHTVPTLFVPFVTKLRRLSLHDDNRLAAGVKLIVHRCTLAGSTALLPQAAFSSSCWW